MRWFGKSRRQAADGIVPSGTSPFPDAIEQRARAIGAELLEAARANQSGWLSRQFWSDKLMNWSMKDPHFKVQLFRFVDAFPSLRTPEQVHDHLVDYLSQPGVKLPPGMGLGIAAGGIAQSLFSKTVTSQITGMAKKFIAGTDAESALPVLRKLWDRNVAFSVDLLGEACVSEAEADAYRARYLDLLTLLPQQTADWPGNPVLERDHLGALPRVNVSIKISSLAARLDAIDPEGSIERAIRSIEPILVAAKRTGALVNFDMEHHALKDLTLALFMQCCERFDFEAGIAMQAYLRSGDADAKRIIDWAQRTRRTVTVRLVKGAYWDYETIRADMENWPTPVWSRKRDTDACFERMTGAFIAACPRSADAGGVKLALGSHNLRSIALALSLLEHRSLPANAIELQMLHGMADALKDACVDRQLRVREYVPVGEMIPGMAYLVRRLLENTSNESWLRAGFLDDAPVEQLLASPHDASVGAALPRVVHADDLPIRNEPMRDFADAGQREKFRRAIETARVPAISNDATVDDVDRAIGRASSALAGWRDVPVRDRAGMLRVAAERMRARRDEIAGIIIRENGKNWRNADADVCEAIDFCDYYAAEAIRLFEHRPLGHFAGELNLEFHEPRGVAAVISPWNFPLAIACGMTTAALVCGNPTILKPAEQTPGIARVLVDVLHDADIPRDVLQLVCGQGETVGAALVRDPRVALIAFTGSKSVGLDILAAAGQTGERQAFVKHVVCEMGGKNAIIVDASADLDEAVIGVRDSAFGFSGQKCSACSRAIVVDSRYDEFVRRLVESTKSLVVGDPLDPATDLGPVIDDDAADKINSYIAIGRDEGTLELASPVHPLGRRYIGPHIFSGIEPHHRLAREEIFGPVLAIMKARDFEHALEIANDSVYRLTGGVFTRKPSHIERAKREFRVGNLYINRGITGALVGRQPFGGFGMSGAGSKAGGRDYLLHFVVPRVVTENTLRRGFAPETA